jgi:myo-inositol-1(or 4)-monophosphatase
MLGAPIGDRKVNHHSDLLSVALDAAAAGARFVREAPRPGRAAWGLKGVSDFVTVVDREAEALIARRLVGGAPGSIVIGEELSPAARTAEVQWVVDPVDGTTNYLHGYPSYGVSIAALVGGVPAVGVVADVERARTYHAVAGGGAWCDGHRLSVSAVRDPADALIGTGFPFKAPDLLPRYLRQFAAIMRATSGIRRAGAASLDFVDIALGRCDGFWELQLAPWDVAAGALIVREAGGRVSDPEGGSEILRHGAFVAGNPAIHAWLIEMLHEIG